jgi:plastocyanin
LLNTPSRHSRVLAALLVALPLAGMVAAAPAQAAPSSATVVVTSGLFSPKKATIAVGGTLTWQFNGPSGQSVIGNPDLGNGFGSGPEPTGASYPFTFAQSGVYNYKDALSGAKGKVIVPLQVSPSSGTTATSFTITFGAGIPAANVVSNVQVSFCPTGQTCVLDWANLYPNDAGTSHTYTPGFGPGTYSLRSQVTNIVTGVSSTVTPTVTVVVSPASAGLRYALPSFGTSGTPVTISGWDFTGATDVRFNGTSVGAGNFTVVSDSTITTTVPAGATSGAVSVVTPDGTATSNGSFTVGAPPAHVVVILMENQSSTIIGQSNTPYLTSLAQQYENATAMFSAQHGSLADYLEITSGIPPGCGAGAHKSPQQCVSAAPSLFHQLAAAGITWKQYSEQYPTPGSCDLLDGAVGAYASWHVPALYLSDTRTVPAQCANLVSLTELDTDLTNSTLPTLSFITPTIYTDMATKCTGTKVPPCPPGSPDNVAQGDMFLSQWVPQLLTAGTDVIVTWDEARLDTDTSGCCFYANGGDIPTVVARSGMAPTTFSTPLDTYSILAAIEEAYGLQPLGRAGCICTSPLPLP